MITPIQIPAARSLDGMTREKAMAQLEEVAHAFESILMNMLFKSMRDTVGKNDLFSGGKWRYRVDLTPASPQQLLAAWDASFDWTMMNDLHVCGASGAGYAYLHGHKLRCQEPDGKQTLNVRGEEARVLHERFGIAPQLVQQARELLVASRAAGADEGRR